MQSIKTKGDARKLVDAMAADSGIEVLIRDDILIHLEEPEYGHAYMVTTDCGTGESWRDFQYLSEMVEIIWGRRKYINKYARLDRFEETA